jgi:hypothetical protein
MKKAPVKGKVARQLRNEQDADREAVLDEREKLRRQFPSAYSAEIGVLRGGKVEVMLTLTVSQAERLASLLKETKL